MTVFQVIARVSSLKELSRAAEKNANYTVLLSHLDTLLEWDIAKRRIAVDSSASMARRSFCENGLKVQPLFRCGDGEEDTDEN